ncbi:uncharacterized protein LOC116307021 [Actinia tenebrosa]|uniref:Uncharacterized protein LOC116307021 n=1 Tax=Actinia tenebrosa TaxID=6105 RepID=A0A6P8J0K8_ACTTE|nr:uncharacterized protein LOC116307021 [Actinia tenebrosa]
MMFKAFLAVFLGAVTYHSNHVTNALFISWKEKPQITADDIFIDLKNLLVPEIPRFNKINGKFLNLTKSLTFDQRCEKGLPLSMAWLPNQPYSGVIGPKRINKTFGFVAFGIFPGVLNQIVSHCCPKSKIVYGKLLRSVRQAEEHLSKNMYDFTYPIYVQRWSSKTYKDQPFIPVIHAPRVVLVVYDDVKISKTTLLIDTIFYAWPFLLFILGAALAAGLLVWILEKLANSKEFTKCFIKGAWDGFWWAVVTMTTVGYGDKSPKTLPGRIFCFLWIIVGINIVASFTALITATVTANTRPYFNAIGAKIGAVNGSEEFRLGVTMNADMIAFNNPSTMTKALKKHEIDGLLIDNYALTRFSNDFAQEKNIRLESTIEHRINYGMVLPSDSNKAETCVRRYMKNYRQDIFTIIAKHLKPLEPGKGGRSDYSVEAAGQLFYQEKFFQKVIKFCGVAVGSLVAFGLIWDFGYRRHKSAFHRVFAERFGCMRKAVLSEDKLIDGNQELTAMEKKRKELLMEHKKFQSKWIDQLSTLGSNRQK